MSPDQEKASRIRNALRFRPKGMTISEISRTTGMNRNSVAKYLDVLLISGQVAMEEIGNAKVYTLSQRVPISAFVDVTRDGVLILDADRRIVQVNEQFLHLAGVGRDEIVDRSLAEIRAQVPVISTICSFLAEGAEREATVDGIPIPDGDEQRYYRAKIIPTVFEDGQHGTTVILEDTTRQTKIRAVEALLACIVDSSDDAIIGENLNGIIASWNAGASRLYGYAAEEAIGRPISLLFPPERREELTYLRSRVHRGERVEHFETVRIAKNGTPIDVAVTLSPILDPDGELIGVSTITRDISTQKTAEAEIEGANQLLSGIIDFLPDATLVVDTNDCIIAWNREMEVLTDLPKSEVLGKGIHSYAVPFYRESRSMINGRPGTPDSPTISMRFRRNGDTVFGTGYFPRAYGKRGAHLWGKASPILDRNGNRIGTIESLRDVTGLRAAEEALRQSERRFRMAVTHAPFPITVVDREGRIICHNQKFTEIFGYGQDDLPTGEELFRQAFPTASYRREARTAWREFVHQAETGMVESRKFRVRCRNGEVKPVLFRATALTDGIYLLTWEDISEARRIYTILLTEMVKMKQAGGDQAGTAIVITDSAGYISFVNRTLLALWGYQGEGEILNRHATELWDEPDEASDLFIRLRQGESWCGMLNGRGRDGTAFSTLVTADPVIAGTGGITTLVLAAVPLHHRLPASDPAPRKRA
ncbi:hypothetical protein ABH15_01135 [Methanoculleus taiwanensis]|uniref:Histidine kinase n=1 Tax=Methanoculleus taiwanensis TaxID=1550565 RepID=A0A498H3W9_9EURY|nr:PAS domain S-box protein [Methanoculleus taiwanensis]RXE56798.1 hypothetical protein ABH15_01135 [Methanoculleus taiwanensis]